MTKAKKIIMVLAVILISCGVLLGFAGCGTKTVAATVTHNASVSDSSAEWLYRRNEDGKYSKSWDGTYTLVGLTSGGLEEGTILPTYHKQAVYHVNTDTGVRTETGQYRFSYTAVENFAFTNYDGFTYVGIWDNYQSVGDYAFWNCSNMLGVTIESANIGNYCFYECSDLMRVWIGVDVLVIGDHAFDGCTSLVDVYYEGTREDWGNVYVGTGNDCFTSDCFRYYSEEKPTDDGYSYWHYINGMAVNW